MVALYDHKGALVALVRDAQVAAVLVKAMGWRDVQGMWLKPDYNDVPVI